jgi:hypothetical protein
MSPQNFLNGIAATLLGDLGQQEHLGRLAGIRRSYVASQRTLVASIVKSRRGVLAKERNFLMHEVAAVCGSIRCACNWAISEQRRPFASTSFERNRNDRCVDMTLSTLAEFGIRDSLHCA